MAAKQQGQLTSAAKAAAVIVALGAEQASHVYKCLHEDEIEQLSLEVANCSKFLRKRCTRLWRISIIYALPKRSLQKVA